MLELAKLIDLIVGFASPVVQSKLQRLACDRKHILKFPEQVQSRHPSRAIAVIIKHDNRSAMRGTVSPTLIRDRLHWHSNCACYQLTTLSMVKFIEL